MESFRKAVVGSVKRRSKKRKEETVKNELKNRNFTLKNAKNRDKCIKVMLQTHMVDPDELGLWPSL